MIRITKAPDVRRQEILDTAMQLFYIKGYESTSMADIANEMNVVPGLCYRYFKSKQELFDCAMDQYVKDSGEKYITIICDDSKSLEQRLNNIAGVLLFKEDNSKYHNFYNKIGNEMLHEQLVIKVIKYILPSICDEIKKLSKRQNLNIRNVEMLTSFLMYGQIGVLSCENVSMDMKIKQIKEYINLMLGLKDNANLCC